MSFDIDQQYTKLTTKKEFLVNVISHHGRQGHNIEGDGHIAIHFLMGKVAEVGGLHKIQLPYC